ncbi:MAG TPA: hypothetical protein VNX47_09320, partial [Nevskia sp.]|nr:hypothetical protein [Nevskia sp.]
ERADAQHVAALELFQEGDALAHGMAPPGSSAQPMTAACQPQGSNTGIAILPRKSVTPRCGRC